MKLRLSYLAILSGVLMLHGCGGGGVLGKTPNDTDTMVPTAGTIDLSTLPHPPANAVTLTTDEHWIYDSAKKPVILRGANLLYGDSPATRINGITALKDQGSNMVRLLLTDKTTDVELEGALAKVIGQGMIAVVSLTTPVFDDATKNTLTCTEKSDFLLSAIDTLWLGKWLPVLSEDKFQAGLMINVANGWGPVGIFNQDSYGYQEYIETYKAIIGKFRTVGFKVPMVIDAPSCGQDFNAFLSGRTRELLAADSAKNIVLGVHASGNRWSTGDKISNAATALYNEKAPFIMTGFTGSGTADVDQAPIDHMDLIKKSVGDAALAFNLPWSGTADATAYTMALDHALDLRGGAAVSFYVFMDKLYGEFEKDSSGHYVPKGKLTIGTYITDAKGNRLLVGSIAAKDVRSNQWSQLKFDVPKSAGDIDPGKLLNGSTSFDLTTVSSVGIEMLANGKPASLKAPIKFDDIAIMPGVPPMYVAGFDTDAEGWSADGAAVSSVNGALAITPSGGSLQLNLDSHRSMIDASKPLDVVMRVFVPAEYASDVNNAYIQMFAQGTTWGWNATHISSSSFKPGEWSDVKFTLPFTAADLNSLNSFGIQFGNINLPKSSPILIDSIVISDPSAKKMKAVVASQYKYAFTNGAEGFYSVVPTATDWVGTAPSKVTATNGELVVTPDESMGGTAVINTEGIHSIGEINLSGPLTIKTKVFIPATYTGNNLKMKLFLQDGASWTWYETPQQTIDLTMLGQWANVEFSIASFPDGFNTKLVPNRLGIIFDGITGLNGGSIKLDDIEFIGTSLIDDSEPLTSIPFATQAQLDAVKFDFGAGTFTESGLATAKYADWKIIPFGWAADTWIGQTGDKAPLNLSKQEGVADLTQRGEEIINSMFGIKATSILATFPPAPPK